MMIHISTRERMAEWSMFGRSSTDMGENARIAALNDKFGVVGRAKIVSGNGGLPKIEIETQSAVGEIYLHGAQVTGWRPSGAEQVLFVSAKSHWEDGKAIRGGIPVCFPWFRAKADDAKAPTHGFVRTKEWRIESITAETGERVSVRLAIESDASTRRWWPFEFRAEYRVTMGSALRLELAVRNMGQRDIRFEEALHSYFHVGDVERAVTHGLDGVAYLDNRDGNRRKEQRGDLRLASQTDNAYLEAAGEILIVDPVLGRTLRTRKQNSRSTIVWNPWHEGAAPLTDLGNDEWRRMLCAEGGNILESTVRLGPGDIHRLGIEISVESESSR
jgi:glucose-6-phosphate 1-epimerase